ncbi:hypothetical protein Tco_1385440 [Tanacetum coccineum]
METQETKKYTLSLHKYHAVPFPNDDIKEQTSRWVSKHLKKFNVYARYGVEHSKNMWAKKFHIRRQKEKRDKPEEVYSDSKIVEVIKTSYELDYKYLNKNDIGDVKYGYVDPSPSDADVEYLKFYEEDTEDHLKHQDQMRSWEMYVNGRLLGSRRDRPE